MIAVACGGRNLFASVLAATGLCLLAPAAEACSITVSPLSFGRYNFLDRTPLDSAGSISYECGRGVRQLRVTIARGTAVSARSRALQAGPSKLNYVLYLDPAKTRVWGDGTEGTEAFQVFAPPAGKRVTVPIYGRIPAGQNVRAGTYSDSITVVVDF